MPDNFTSALLAALNNSAEIKAGDWASIEAVLRPSQGASDGGQQSLGFSPENRLAATVSSGMAKIRARR